MIGGWLKTEAQFYVKHQARSSISFWLWSPASYPLSFAGSLLVALLDPTTKHVLRSEFPVTRSSLILTFESLVLVAELSHLALGWGRGKRITPCQ